MGAGAIVVVGALAAHHVAAVRHLGASNFELIAAATFVWLCLISVFTYAHRDASVPGRHARGRRSVDRLRVCVVVPAHNEDPAMFAAMLESLTNQTRQPDRVHVIENGYETPLLRSAFQAWAAGFGGESEYTLHPPAGKREAQAIGFRADPTADIFLTLDSDVELSPGAVASGLVAFADPRITSVAGVLVGRNHRRNLLTRLVELSYVCSFLNGRALGSMFGCVAVNCGGLAFYQARMVRRFLDHYLAHTVAGRVMPYGDDAMMTRYAMLAGRTVLQVDSWGYTLHPENMNHLTRQRVRWWRSFFWGNQWLLRAFPVSRAIWWMVMWRFVSFALLTAVIPVVLVIGPAWYGVIPWMFLAWVVGVSYLTNARYLTIRRPGEDWWSHLVTWLLAPLSGFLNLYLGFVLQYWGLFTCLKTGWGTRQKVEVGAE